MRQQRYVPHITGSGRRMYRADLGVKKIVYGMPLNEQYFTDIRKHDSPETTTCLRRSVNNSRESGIGSISERT